MHDIKWIRDNPAAFDAGLKRRGLAPMSASLLAIDETRRAAILKSEQAQARRNAASKEIGDAKKAKDDARATALMAEVTELKSTMPQLELAAKTADETAECQSHVASDAQITSNRRQSDTCKMCNALPNPTVREMNHKVFLARIWRALRPISWPG